MALPPTIDDATAELLQAALGDRQVVVGHIVDSVVQVVVDISRN